MNHKIPPGKLKTLHKVAERYAIALRKAGGNARIAVIDGTIYVDGNWYRPSAIKAMTRELNDREERSKSFVPNHRPIRSAARNQSAPTAPQPERELCHQP